MESAGTLFASLIRIGAFVAMALLVSGPLSAQGLLDPLLARRPAGGPAAVVYAWTPEETHAAVAGRLKTGGRAAVVEDQFYVASVSKTYLAVAVLQLHERGLLDVQDDAADYLPSDIVDGLGGMQGMTIEHLLRMQSGLADYLTWALEQDIIANPKGPWPPARVLSYAFDRPRVHRLGTGFDYSNTNYVLLQMILEEVSGQAMHDYLRANVLRPAGARSAYVHGTQARSDRAVHGYEDLRDRGVEDVSWYYQTPMLGDGFLVTSAEEIASFYRALLVDRTLLRPKTLAMMLRDEDRESYGMGIEVDEDPELGMFMGHSGGDNGFSAHVYYLEDLEMIVVSLRADDSSDASIIYEAVELLDGG